MLPATPPPGPHTAQQASSRCALQTLCSRPTHRCSEAAASLSSFSSPIIVCAVLFLITVVSAWMAATATAQSLDRARASWNSRTTWSALIEVGGCKGTLTAGGQSAGSQARACVTPARVALALEGIANQSVQSPSHLNDIDGRMTGMRERCSPSEVVLVVAGTAKVGAFIILYPADPSE